MYVFADDAPDYWEALFALGKEMSASWMWEISASATKPERRESVRKLLPRIGCLSLNRTEARRMLQTDSMPAAVSMLLDAGVGSVALRMGQDGSLVADATGSYRIPACQTQVVDPTGAGNAYSGAFLVGYCEHHDIVTAGKWGSVAASFMLEQYGLPPKIPDLQPEARKRAAALAEEPVSLNR